MRFCCRLIRWWPYRFTIAWRWMVCAVLALGAIHAVPLQAAETYVIRSEKQYLHLWSGPGTEYQILSSLPNGTKVIVHEYWGQWAKISLIVQRATEGWVLKRHLTAEGQTATKPVLQMDREQEQRRFGRLRRKGVLGVHRDGAGGVLRLTINHLLWHRLPAIQQENFLRRARQFFGASVVEVQDQYNAMPLARLTANGVLEIASPPTTPSRLLEETTSTSPSGANQGLHNRPEQ